MKLALVLLIVASLNAQVRVEKAAFHNWPDAVVLKNAVAAVVIVPSIGRVMNFSFLDKAGQPLLKFNNSLLGDLIRSGIYHKRVYFKKGELDLSSLKNFEDKGQQTTFLEPP